MPLTSRHANELQANSRWSHVILNASRVSTVLIAGHFGNKLYQIPLDNTYQTYSANTRAIAELQKASPTCSVCTSSSAKHSTNGRMRVRANRTRLHPGSTRFSRPRRTTSTSETREKTKLCVDAYLCLWMTCLMTMTINGIMIWISRWLCSGIPIAIDGSRRRRSRSRTHLRPGQGQGQASDSDGEFDDWV